MRRNARGSLSFTGALTADPQNRSKTGVSLADLLLGLPLIILVRGSPGLLLIHFVGHCFTLFQ